MKLRNRNIVSRTKKLLVAGLAFVAVCSVLTSCGGTTYRTPSVVQVGTSTVKDANLPEEPTLPTAAQVCSTLQASDFLVARPDGSLPPEMDPSVPGVGVAVNPATANPDQVRIQAALDACGVAVDAQVGSTIAVADAAAAATQIAAALPNINISGATAEELAKPQYHATQFAVRLVVSSTGKGGNAFISGPLNLPSGVTLWIDKGVTLFASRDVMAYWLKPATPVLLAKATTFCANVAVSAIKAGSSGNCLALITGTNLVNSAVVGDGSIDSRGYGEIVTTDAMYPIMKVDLSCSNTYAAYIGTTVPLVPSGIAPQGTPCDNGGTFVNLKSSARNMTWWDLAWLGNMVDSGTTGVGSQSVHRMMLFNNAKNLTLYHLTLSNSANFHVVPSGIDGLTVWGVKVQTPSLAAFQNPTGNGNPLYNGQTFTPGGFNTPGNVKNTDAFDVGAFGTNKTALAQAVSLPLTTSSKTVSAGKMYFDGYLKNTFFAYNYISSGDDDIALKGSNNPTPIGSGLAAVDGTRGVNSAYQWGIVIAHNHIYSGHGISIGSETNSGVRNVHVYDNSFNGSEEGLRIKSDDARGGEVMNIYYSNICMQSTGNALLFTPYYSTKALPAGGPLYPNFHDIFLTNVSIQGSTSVTLRGLAVAANNPQYPLVMTLNNVVTDSPSGVGVINSDANLKLMGLNNLPLFNSPEVRVVVTGATPMENIDPATVLSSVIDCSQAYVNFPSVNSPTGTGWPMPIN